MGINPFSFKGLSTESAKLSQRQFGKNEEEKSDSSAAWPRIKAIVTEPMFVILLAASLLYLVMDQVAEAVFMGSALLVVTGISYFQESRSRNALAALQSLTAPKVRVVRDDTVIELPVSDVVVGDFLLAEEGTTVGADGLVVYAHDFTVNESFLTGESSPVFKEADGQHRVSKGSAVSSGLALVQVEAVGTQTQLGKIARSLSTLKAEKTPLQQQMNRFVSAMAAVGAGIFFLIFAFHYYTSHELIKSLLQSLTIAMSVLPEEIPVAFTTFMALGAWRLAKAGVLVKDLKTVETLGAATVICTDKTGTITENDMVLLEVYRKGTDAPTQADAAAATLIENAMWASEPVPFDPMEIAIHAAYERLTAKDLRKEYSLFKEYPLSGKPPMMTHIFRNAAGSTRISAKGAPEALLQLVTLHAADRTRFEKILAGFQARGLRVLAVASAEFTGDDFPKDQQQLPFVLQGLLAFQDPPKKNIGEVFRSFHDAGIAIKLITGDNALTSKAIAKQVGLELGTSFITGDELLQAKDHPSDQKIERTVLFSRMFPEAKLQVIETLKKMGHLVAMTGDGVNDAPALKAATIGIAMGKRGSQVARDASALILVNDDLKDMVTAIAMGRKIYTNLKKAVRYIISIHIPIILTVSLPLLLHWKFPDILSPVHVIFLELIMGPTCSIVFENEPAEPGSMLRPPRRPTTSLFSRSELLVSLAQGLVITFVIGLVYQGALAQQASEAEVRTLVFHCLVTANIVLTLVNRSFTRPFWRSSKTANPLLNGVLAITVLLVVFINAVPAVQRFFGLADLSFRYWLLCIAAGTASVLWMELLKMRQSVNVSARNNHG